MLLLHLLLLATGHAAAGPTAGYASYTVVTPRELPTRAGKAAREQLSYLIQAEGKDYVVHLQRKALLAKRFPVATYNSSQRVEGHHEVQGDCYYHGYVEGAGASFLSLRACPGLSGLLQIEDLTYGISPLQGSPAFQHLLYRAEEGAPSSRAGRPRGKAERHAVPAAGRRPAPSKGSLAHLQRHTKYMELFVQVDVRLFRFYEADVQATIQNVIHLIEMVDDMFATLGLRVLLVGVEIWTERNLVPVTDYVQLTVGQFNAWRVLTVRPRLRHDVALLLAHHGTGGSTVRYSYLGTVCKTNAAVAFVSARNVTGFLFALGIAHELGHVIGIPDDPSPTCYCAPKLRCIMNARGPHASYPRFSNCSTNAYLDILHAKKVPCLSTTPAVSKIFALSSCGNGIVEGEEQCDCGVRPACKQSGCCREDCTLAPRATCTTEACCVGCQLAPKGALCRKASDECDLPEYCSGAAADCAPDVLVQDGTPCSDDGYCVAGTCSTHTLQCQKLFSGQAAGAPPACFERVNAVGDRFGNCAGKRGEEVPPNFPRCARENVLCGRVQCVNVHTLPNMEESTTVIQTPVGKAVCWGLASSSSGTALADIGVVEEGSRCGKRKVCVNQTCTPVETWAAARAACDPSATCGGNGVCNSRQHCHCRYGWAPPACRSPGYGGSLDSGPLPRTRTYSLASVVVGVAVATLLAVAAGGLVAWGVREAVLARALRKGQPQAEGASPA
ncbi:disintegrin and metalloproteinase domain-containing protein 9-like [Varanus komodoensis]|uniref:disintegrin and metalloproteinase domain-containing protein 9-like n=1 Tax=Varanus komodoensis TaxID=61221 RepID=UPI001CF7D225|nr:disintegrin and metalloproteinase domain-containing protein 9-like [Varanus komodoensis]